MNQLWSCFRVIFFDQRLALMEDMRAFLNYLFVSLVVSVVVVDRLLSELAVSFNILIIIFILGVSIWGSPGPLASMYPPKGP